MMRVGFELIITVLADCLRRAFVFISSSSPKWNASGSTADTHCCSAQYVIVCSFLVQNIYVIARTCAWFDAFVIATGTCCSALEVTWTASQAVCLTAELLVPQRSCSGAGGTRCSCLSGCVASTSQPSESLL